MRSISTTALWRFCWIFYIFVLYIDPAPFKLSFVWQISCLQSSWRWWGCVWSTLSQTLHGSAILYNAIAKHVTQEIGTTLLTNELFMKNFSCHCLEDMTMKILASTEPKNIKEIITSKCEFHYIIVRDIGPSCKIFSRQYCYYIWSISPLCIRWYFQINETRNFLR